METVCAAPLAAPSCSTPVLLKVVVVPLLPTATLPELRASAMSAAVPAVPRVCTFTAPSMRMLPVWLPGVVTTPAGLLMEALLVTLPPTVRVTLLRLPAAKLEPPAAALPPL